MHDLLRGYARELSACYDGEAEEQAALTRLFDYYLAAAGTSTDTLFPAERDRRPRVGLPATCMPPVETPAAARAWLDAERANLVAIARHASRGGWAGHTTRLAVIMFRYLDYGGYYPEALTIQRTPRRRPAGRRWRGTGRRIAKRQHNSLTGKAGTSGLVTSSGRR